MILYTRFPETDKHSMPWTCDTTGRNHSMDCVIIAFPSGGRTSCLYKTYNLVIFAP